MKVDPVVIDEILGHQVDLMRLEAGVRNRVMRLLTRLQVELSSRLSAGSPLSEYTKARLSTLMRQSTETIDAYYARIEGTVDEILRGVADVQARFSGSIIITTGATLPTETFLKRLVSNILIHGAPSAEWWQRQSQDLVFRFTNVVRQGVALGETNAQIVARVTGSPRLGISGIMGISRANARSLVHSSIQTVANAARMETFRQNRGVVKGVRQVSTFDGHTTPTCIAYADQSWDLDGNPIAPTKLPFVNDGGALDGTPRHWNCRSVMVPITKTYRELGLNIDELPSVTRPGGAKSMDDWLSRRSKEQLDEQLGPGRAELFRQGKITREQLLNLSGNPLTLAQLQSRYA